MRLIFALILIMLPLGAHAQERIVSLHAPPALAETGLLAYVTPRFSLKTQIRVEQVDSADEADITLGAEGTPVFEGAGSLWHLAVQRETEWSARFAEWLTSEIGERTILAYAPDGDALFSLPPIEEEAEAAPVFDGDAQQGRLISREKCARCHAVDEDTRMSAIGSAPSFFLLRGFANWEDRFEAFYSFNPHQSFTQVEDITEPWPEERPSPIVQMDMTLAEIDAVLAYVASLKAADLGAPLQPK